MRWPMRIERFAIAGPALLLPQRHYDDRGYLAETFQFARFGAAIGMPKIVQENLVWSGAVSTVRGLHAQAPPNAQAKLVSVMVGRILDVVVDIRRESQTYGQHLAIELTAAAGAMLYVPSGFLHGYRTLEANTLVQYKLDALYAPSSELAVRFDDPALAIEWGAAAADCLVSDKDRGAQSFATFASPFSDTAAS
jgi:dTDP-4-dehydrorhamnose 3,5-epimerase